MSDEPETVTGIPAIDQLWAERRREQFRNAATVAVLVIVLVYAFIENRSQTSTIADLTESLNRRSGSIDYQAALGQQTTCRNDVINEYRVFSMDLYQAVVETDPARREERRANLIGRKDHIAARLVNIDKLCPPPPPPEPLEPETAGEPDP